MSCMVFPRIVLFNQGVVFEDKISGNNQRTPNWAPRSKMRQGKMEPAQRPTSTAEPAPSL